MNNEALLVVDMLNDFVSEEGALYIGEAAADVLLNTRKILTEERSRKVPVIYICDEHRSGDAEFNLFPVHCLQETAGSQVIREIAPLKKDYIIRKRRYSAFCGTDLDILLRELNVNCLIMTGVCTNICILYTAADARMLGYEVQVVEDAVGSFDQEAHRFALQELKNTLGAEILSAHQLMERDA